jgi:hypothetical protein
LTADRDNGADSNLEQNMKKITVSLTGDEMESILDALEHAEENELCDRLGAQFSSWMNEKDAAGVYVNRGTEQNGE